MSESFKRPLGEGILSGPPAKRIRISENERLHGALHFLESNGIFYNDALDKTVTTVPFALGDRQDFGSMNAVQKHSLRGIQAITGCTIQFTGEEGAPPNRVFVKGQIAYVGRAVHLMLESFPQFRDDELHLTLLIHPDAIGGIVGKGGQGLRAVREASSCQMTVEREPDARFGCRTIVMRAPEAYKITCAVYRMIRNPRVIDNVDNTVVTHKHVIPTFDPRLIDCMPHLRMRRDMPEHHLRMMDPRFIDSMFPMKLPRRDHFFAVSRNHRDKENDKWFAEAMKNLMKSGFIRGDETDNEEAQFNCLVFDEFVAGIIGKEGASINELKRIAECHISFEKRDQMQHIGASERKVQIKGTNAGITSAIYMLLYTMCQMCGIPRIEFTMLMDPTHAAILTHGQHLQEIEALTGVKLFLEPQATRPFGGRRLVLAESCPLVTARAVYECLRAVSVATRRQRPDCGGLREVNHEI